jgi:LAS superfamily LD-carboxypeptidase LdcB
MTRKIEIESAKQSGLLAILFTILSFISWVIILMLIFKIPALTWVQQKLQPLLTQNHQPPASDKTSAVGSTQVVSSTVEPVENLITDQENYLKEIALDTIRQYEYSNFFYPVSQDMRLPLDFPTKVAQIPLVSVGEVSMAEIVAEPLNNLMQAAKAAGFSPYLRSGFRSIEDQHTAFSRYVTEATASGWSLSEAREYASQFSAVPGYSEHHLGLAIDLLDYFYSDWIVARNNFDKGLYLWLRQHAHEYGFVISYPSGNDYRLAKPGSGYALSEPWHLRFVGKDLAIWFFQNGYLDPQNEMTINGILLEIYRVPGRTSPVQKK